MYQEKLKRSANYTVEELDTIVYNMELRPDLVSGKIGGEYKTFEEQRQAWIEIANEVNANGLGTVRNYLEIKRKWQDFKHRVKAKVFKAMEQSEKGIPMEFQLSPLEERVYVLLEGTATLPSLEREVTILQNEDVKNEDITGDEQDVKPFQSKNLSSSTPCQKRKSHSNNESREKNNDTLAREVKELKSEIKKLRESVCELVNIKKTELKLKCFKYGTNLDDFYSTL